MSLWRFVLRISCLLTLFACLVCCLPSHGLVNGTELLEARQAPAGKLLTLADVTAPKLLQLMCRKPGPGQCLFYTADQGNQAWSFVKQPNKLGLTMTIWDAWPNEYYNMNDDPSNMLQNIVKLPKPASQMTKDDYEGTDRYKYFQQMSQALAMTCSGWAVVMTPDVNNIPSDGIWANTEEVQLQANTGSNIINQIYAINSPSATNPGGAIQKTIFQRPTSRRHNTAFVEKRDECGCGFQGTVDNWSGAIYY